MASSETSDIKQMEADGNVKGLLKVLNRDDVSVRIDAIQALGELKTKEANVPLCEMLWDENEDIRHSAYQALSQIGSSALSPLLDSMGSTDKPVSVMAIKLLGEWRDDRALPVLIGELKKVRKTQAELDALNAKILVLEFAANPYGTAQIISFDRDPAQLRAEAARKGAPAREQAEELKQFVQQLEPVIHIHATRIVEALNNLGKEEAAAPLATALSEGKTNFGTEIEEVLKSLGYKSSPEEQQILSKKPESGAVFRTTGTCDITGKEGCVTEVPYPIYKIEQPENDADELQKLETAQPQTLKIGEDVFRECRVYLAKIAQRCFIYGLLSPIFLVLLVINSDSPIFYCGAPAIMFLVMGIFLIRMIRYSSVLKLSTPDDYVFKSYHIDAAFKNKLNIEPVKFIFKKLPGYLTERSGEFAYYSEGQRETRLKRLQRRVKK